jgi:hypothetical protein
LNHRPLGQRAHPHRADRGMEKALAGTVTAGDHRLRVGDTARELYAAAVHYWRLAADPVPCPLAAALAWDTRRFLVRR